MNQTTQHTSGIVIAGLSGGSGKSAAAVGLLAALARRGMKARAFKKGPDYIDAGWLARASGLACYNLDAWLAGPEATNAAFFGHLSGMDCAVVEGNRGLFDGVDAAGGFSTAELAILLDLPVILVINCAKLTRTAAALAQLRQLARFEGRDEETRAEFDALEAKLKTNDLATDLRRFRQHIQPYLENEIVSRYYYQRGALQQQLTTDKALRKAVETLTQHSR